MTCVVSKMEKSYDKKTVQSNFKFVVQLWRSAVYRRRELPQQAIGEAAAAGE